MDCTVLISSVSSLMSSVSIRHYQSIEYLQGILRLYFEANILAILRCKLQSTSTNPPRPKKSGGFSFARRLQFSRHILPHILPLTVGKIAIDEQKNKNDFFGRGLFFAE